MATTSKRYDAFLCHASEDKEEFVRPLVRHLRELGLRVWYDEHTLEPGDRLRRSIDRGLSQSRYGVVILSHHFFAKHWPQVELDGLAQRETGGEKIIRWGTRDVGFSHLRWCSHRCAPDSAAIDSSVIETVRCSRASGSGLPPLIGPLSMLAQTAFEERPDLAVAIG